MRRGDGARKLCRITLVRLPDEAERVWQALSEQRRALTSRKAAVREHEHEHENEHETDWNCTKFSHAGLGTVTATSGPQARCAEGASQNESEARGQPDGSRNASADAPTVAGAETEIEIEIEIEAPLGSSENVSAETGRAPTMADAAVAMAERALADTAVHDNSGADRRLLFIHLAERRLPHATETAETGETPAGVRGCASHRALGPWGSGFRRQPDVALWAPSSRGARGRLSRDAGRRRRGRRGRRADVLRSERSAHSFRRAGAGRTVICGCGPTARGARTSRARTHDLTGEAGAWTYADVWARCAGDAMDDLG